MNQNIKWITQTALCTAFLIVLQLLTSSFGNTLVTGSFVNMVLIISLVMCGISTDITVAIVSPVFAKLIGIGPLWSLIPCIVLGNISIILIWYIFANKYKNDILAWLLGAVTKFFVLYVGVVRFTIPILLKLPEKKAIIISTAFSIPQLITALIGGGIALIIVPVLKKSRVYG